MSIHPFIKRTLFILTLSLGLTGCGSSELNEDKTSSKISEEVTMATGTYEDYTPDRFKELLGSEKFILFFHADWCPTCRALEKEIKENLNKLNSHVILEVNYDTEADLKKEYEVMMQSTLIFFNSNGSIFEKRVNPDFELIEKFFY